MTKITIPSTSSGYNLSVINAGLQALVNELNTKVLYRDNPAGEANAMEQLLDMNGMPIINAGEISASSLSINGVLVEPGVPIAAATQQVFEFTATAGQTTFDISPLTPASTGIVMEVDGIAIPPSSLSVTGSTVGFPALSLGREVVLRIFTRDVGTAPTASDVLMSTPTGVTRNIESKLQEIISVKDFGAQGDGVTDDTGSIQAAIDYVASLGGGTVYFPFGTYIITATITANDAVTHLVGAGVNSTILQINHTSGPGITMSRYFSGISHMLIRGSSARLAAAAGTNYGVYFPSDPLIAQSRFVNYVKGCQIQNHPNHGIYMQVTACWVEDCRILDIGGHGFYGDGYSASYLFGFAEIKNSQIARCTGHGVCIGVNYRAYRTVLNNVDIFHCALAAGVRQSAHSAWVNTENAFITSCGFQGNSGDSPSRVLTIAGLFLNGRSPVVHSNRFIDCLGHCVQLGADADGAVIEDNHIVGDVVVAMDPAVVVDAGCVGVKVRWGFPAFVTSAMTVAPSNTGNRSEIYDLSPQGFRSALQAITIADDAVHILEFTTAATFGMLALSSNSSGARQVLIAFRVGDGSAYCNLLSTAANVATTTGALTGTTGTDGNLTFSVSTTENKLYIENRRGASYQWMPTMLSLTNGEFKVI